MQKHENENLRTDASRYKGCELSTPSILLTLNVQKAFSA